MKKILALGVLALVSNGAYAAAADVRMEGYKPFQRAVLFSSKRLQVVLGSRPMQSVVSLPLNDDYSPKNEAHFTDRGLIFRRSDTDNTVMELCDATGNILCTFQVAAQ